MDGGVSKTGNSAVNFKGPYDETKKYIPIDLVDKDYIYYSVSSDNYTLSRMNKDFTFFLCVPFVLD